MNGLEKLPHSHNRGKWHHTHIASVLQIFLPKRIWSYLLALV